MRILHTADLHLREYGDDRWITLQKLIEIAKKEGIEVFVISGDLFDKDIDAEDLRPRIRKVFSKTGLKIVVIPGNHDVDSYKRGMYFGDDTIVLTDMYTPFEYKGISIWGLPFEPVEGAKVLNKLLSLTKHLSNDKKNILLFHGELIDAFFSRKDFGAEGEERYMPVKLSYFTGLNIDYVLAGHFHSRFDVRELKHGGYFVYPGSPISITKKETGQRRVNIFEPGNPPMEYLIDTPHFEELIIELDPFNHENPIDVVKETLKDIHPNAGVILSIRGFINCKTVGMSEAEIVEKIRGLCAKRCVEEHYEFRDSQMILDDDLFRTFLKKLEQTDYEENQKRQMRDMAIRAIMGRKS